MRKAFTLIELLIVIAIIAILALIAIPNFLEAQVRSKVARIQADMRSLATAFESYTVDYNRPPIGLAEAGSNPNVAWGIPTGWTAVLLLKSYSTITTPIAYATTIPQDPFTEKSGQIGTAGLTAANYRPPEYESVPNPDAYTVTFSPNEYRAMRRGGYTWFVWSIGPSRNRAGVMPPAGLSRISSNWPDAFYDPSNGTMSRGLIIRSNKGQH